MIVSLLEEKLGKQQSGENVPTDKNVGIPYNTVVCVVLILIKMSLLLNSVGKPSKDPTHVDNILLKSEAHY